MRRGLFVGLATLDLIYQVTEVPLPNQKIVALDDDLAAGGPATNAAVTFGYLGNAATLLAGVGVHSLSRLVTEELAARGVAIADLTPHRTQALPTSSILVTQATGERAVVSRNAVKFPVAVEAIPDGILHNQNIVLIDGHQMSVGAAIAQEADAQNIPVVLDGGSWKTGFETILPQVDYAICSAHFQPPPCHSQAEIFAYLTRYNIPHIAITQGGQPIQYLDQGTAGEIPVPEIQPVDTLGAGDVFHGAFCHFILQTDFRNALAQAAGVAAAACQSFGTRQWMGDRTLL